MKCPVCSSQQLTLIIRLSDGPIMQHKLHNTVKSAQKEKPVQLTLYGCNNCSFVFNGSFKIIKTEYESNYDNTQDYSHFFYKYLTTLAKRLKNSYKLDQKRVVEVGCGKGHFLKILYDLGVRNLRGFDPTYYDFDKTIDKLVTKKFFNKSNSEQHADFIICRHVIEHIPEPKKFVAIIAECLTKKGQMYFEFPNLEWIIKNEVFFDFFYEHCNYFSKNSVIKLFRGLGFENITFHYGLGKQYFQVELGKDKGKKQILKDTVVDFNLIERFIKRKMNQYLEMINPYKHFIIWGAGAKGVTFVNRLKINTSKCPYIIDINPNKINKFIPITGQKIVAPEILLKEKFDCIFIMNPAYEREIRETASTLGYNKKLISV